MQQKYPEQVYTSILENSTEVHCPECDSRLFIQTISIRKVSALLTGTGKVGIVPLPGQVICLKCHRQLVDTDIDIPNDENKDKLII